MGESYFDGGLLQLIGWSLLGSLITVCTFGICFPWAICMIFNGHRLRFTGKATNLFLQWIKWFLLCIITLGIYSFWLSIAIRKWKVAHTEFAD